MARSESMAEVVAKVVKILESVKDRQFAAELIVDVVTSSTGRLGGRPRKTPFEPLTNPFVTPFEPVTKPPQLPASSSDLKKEEEKNTTSSVPSDSVMVFAVVGKTNEWHLTQRFVDECAKSYPEVDIMAAFRKARLWCESNPGKRKTAKGMAAFLANWLARNQDRPAQPFVERRQVPRIPQPNAQIAATDKLLKDHRTCETHKADPSVKRTDPVHWCRICQGPQVVYSANPQPGAPGVVLAALMARSTST